MQKHCAKTGNPLYVFDTEDLVGNARTPLNMEQKYVVASMKADDSNRQTGSNSSRIEVAIGMKVMVTLNLATEADLANGTRGLIQDIVLQPWSCSSHTNTNLIPFPDSHPVLYRYSPP